MQCAPAGIGCDHTDAPCIAPARIGYDHADTPCIAPIRIGCAHAYTARLFHPDASVEIQNGRIHGLFAIFHWPVFVFVDDFIVDIYESQIGIGRVEYGTLEPWETPRHLVDATKGKG